MKPCSIAEAVSAMHGSFNGPANLELSGIAFDTRLAHLGNLFYALKTDKNDGHQYLSAALANGCCAAVVDHLVESSLPQIVVPNTLTALGDFASYYRDSFDVPVIGITGSVGKTTVKEMTALTLSSLNPHATRSNLNNEIGVPITLFGIEPTHGAAIIEMGMRARGEIATLAAIARPTVAVITNIGISHVQVVGSRDGIACAKAELLEPMTSDDLAILPADDDYFSFLADTCKTRCRFVSFGSSPYADYRVTSIVVGPESVSFQVNNIPISLQAVGAHLPINAAAAFAVASELAISTDLIVSGLAAYQPPPMRLNRIELTCGITLIDDTYNAAPDSMIAAIEALRLVAGGRRSVAILGEMRELGDMVLESYTRVSQSIEQRGPNVLITIGEARSIASKGITRIEMDSPEHAMEGVPDLLRSGDVVLVKASRAMALERVVEAILCRFPTVGPANVADHH